jgi:16S rRNA processing protein RimM
LRGFVLVHSETDNPARFRSGSRLETDAGETLEVASASISEAGVVLVRFDGVSDRTAAEALRGVSLWIEEADRRALGPDEYWPDDLVGYAVVSTAGVLLGTVTGLVEGAAQDRLVVATPAGVTEVPFVTALVPEVDPIARTVVVDDIEGLIDGR